MYMKIRRFMKSNTITCKQCGEEIEVSEALTGQIEQQILAAEHKKHQAELQRVVTEAAETAKREREAALTLTKKHLDGEKELLKREAAAELEIEKKKLASDQQMLIRKLQSDAEEEKASRKQLEESNGKMREELGEMMRTLREEKKARAEAELDAQKKLAAEEAKIREDATKLADERQRLNIAAKEKQLQDALKVNEELQRKLQQGSQQLQGEVMELDLERTLAETFRDDILTPSPKVSRRRYKPNRPLRPEELIAA